MYLLLNKLEVTADHLIIFVNKVRSHGGRTIEGGQEAMPPLVGFIQGEARIYLSLIKLEATADHLVISSIKSGPMVYRTIEGGQGGNAPLLGFIQGEAKIYLLLNKLEATADHLVIFVHKVRSYELLGNRGRAGRQMPRY